MADQNPYAAPKTVAHDEEKPLHFQRTGTRWRTFPAALLAATGAWVLVMSFAPLLFDGPVVLFNVKISGDPVVLFNITINGASAILCFAAGCSWLISANALNRRWWSRAVVWLGVGIGCVGGIAWLNQIVPP